MKLKLIPGIDPILKTPTEKINFLKPQVELDILEASLKETLFALKGHGLACNQVGLPYRAFAIGNHKKPEHFMVCYNPSIVQVGEETEYDEEGCLSYPGFSVSIKRYKTIKIRWADKTGVAKTFDVDGFNARIMQHEIAHLDGKTLKDFATRYHMDRAIKKARKNGYNYVLSDF